MGAGYRLLTIALLALVTIIAFEAMAISTAMPAVAKDLDAVRSYGLAFSFMLTAELLGIVLAGVWADRSGPLPSLFAGQLLMVAGSAMAGLVRRGSRGCLCGSRGGESLSREGRRRSVLLHRGGAIIGRADGACPTHVLYLL